MLPENPKQNWPPDEWKDYYNVMDEHSAWYSGDPNIIAAVHSDRVFTPSPQGRFWAREVHEERRLMVHTPIAADVSETSSDMLFGEAPEFSTTQDSSIERLAEITDGGFMALLLEAAEIASALGGVFLRAGWNKDVRPDRPIISIVHPDAAIPTFEHGVMTDVIFWKEVGRENATVWRLLQLHEPGTITSALYEGNAEKIGSRVDLMRFPSTAALDEVEETGLDTLDCVYVPNKLPNRRARGTPIGQSDYAGSEGLLDGLDEIVTSWIRDVRLGQSRVVVPDEFLEGSLDGKKFSIDREVFSTLNMTPQLANEAGIKEIQFEIRADAHLTSALTVMERIVSNAGYSPQSFGLNIEGRAESGTALRIRERKSIATSKKKMLYWRPAVEKLLGIVGEIDRRVFNKGFEEARMNPAAPVTPDMNETAQTVQTLDSAEAISVDQKVRMLHPEWSEEEVEMEVEAIRNESGMAVSSPVLEGDLE